MNALVGFVDRVSARAALFLYRIGVFGALPALLILVSVDVLFRYLFSAPLPWAREANGLLLLIVLFGTLPHAWDRGQHIRMEILYTRLHGLPRVFADAATVVAATAFTALLAAEALAFTRYMLVTGETGEDLTVPLWPFMLFVALCSIVLVARLIANPQGERPGVATEDD